MNFENFDNNIEKPIISEDVQEQLDNLDLTIEDVTGKILDIGAGEAQFARELKDISDADIVSVDDYKKENVVDDIIIADVRELPFEDNSFDRVVSHASIPNVFIGMYSEEFSESSKEEIIKSIQKSFREILRVLKSGSSAVMAPIRIANNYNSEKALASSLEKVLDEIKTEGVSVSFDLIKEVENPSNKEKSKSYRLTLLKK